MRGFHVISSKNRWAIRSGLRWSEFIGAPTASIGDVQSCRLGRFLLWQACWPPRCRRGIKGQTPAMMNPHRAFELCDRLRLAFSWERGICIGYCACPPASCCLWIRRSVVRVHPAVPAKTICYGIFPAICFPKKETGKHMGSTAAGEIQRHRTRNAPEALPASPLICPQ
jgi:hypothetical protein